MNGPDPNEELLALFERHGVELEPDEEWLLTDGDFPAVRASWHEGGGDAPGRLDLDIVPDEARQFELSYAGHGGGGAGLRDALARLARGDLHVLLAACWYVTDDRMLDLATWTLGGRDWDAFIGRLQIEGAELSPPDWQAAIAGAAGNESLPPGLHAIRLVTNRDVGDSLAVECLLDNAPWPAGARALAALPWPGAGTAYRAGALVMLDVRDY